MITAGDRPWVTRLGPNSEGHDLPEVFQARYLKCSSEYLTPKIWINSKKTFYTKLLITSKVPYNHIRPIAKNILL